MSVISGGIAHFFRPVSAAISGHGGIVRRPFPIGDPVTHSHKADLAPQADLALKAEFAIAPHPTVFVVNVIHAHPGRQEEAFRIIQDVVHYVAERKEGFLWSNLSKSTDGKTVVNIEAIRDENNVGEFFSDPVFAEKFKRLDTVSKSEFHIYRVADLVLPGRPVG